MPTRRRKESVTGLYHVVVKGINKERIFNAQREKVYFKGIILKQLERFNVEIYSYCIMSNHAHFIIRADIKVLSAFMAKILAEYASYYNYKHHRNGHVFQNRFMSECIENERYFWTCLRYIHLNPVKANMIKKPERYKHSSMAEFFTETPCLIHEKAIIMYKRHFRDYCSFEKFHKERQKELFIDDPDGTEKQFVEIALYIAEQMLVEKRLTLINQVFEEKTIREEYIERLKKELKIGIRKAKKLCVEIHNKVENA